MSDKWLRAAAIGSIWASVEIVFGSFLHNLRLPLAGSILSFFAVMLMVSFLRLWPQKGILWRAGLICALMKSISPSAVILGPMTGIILEAMLMELSVGILGINLAGILTGGALAVLSALFHKAVNLIILYGINLAVLLNRLVEFAARQLQVESISGPDLLVFLAIIYLVAGMAAAMAGWALARASTRTGRETQTTAINPEQANRLFSFSERQNYSAFLLVGHLVALIGLLVAISRIRAEWWSGPLVAYLLFCLIRYRRALKQLFRPRFWAQMMLITLLSALLLQSVTTGHLLERSGFTLGIMMNVRAILVMTAFTAISTEMKNPLVKTVIFRRGLAGLYRSVSLAFSVLPGIIGLAAENRKRGMSFRTVIAGYLAAADSILERFRALEANLPPVTLVTGDRGQGKTAKVMEMISELQKQGRRVSGFVAIGIQDGNGHRRGFMIRNVVTGEETEFCREEGDPGWERIGRFSINPIGQARGYEWMTPDRILGSDVLVIDEIGPLEMAGKGWSDLVDRILRETPKPMIWTARRNLAGKVAVRWNVGSVTIVDVGN